MLIIDHLRMQLPAGFEHRAENIARLIGDDLASFESKESQHYKQLAIGPIRLTADESDLEIAKLISQQINLKLENLR